ncbi:hypothetical protein ACWEOO_05595 [Kribbella sp. NPDC004138]
MRGFRGTAPRADPPNAVGGYQMLTDYLRGERVTVGQPGSRVALVDTSFKGSAQELLAAVYPETEFVGRYAFHGESPDDPHPGSKKGYEVHDATGPVQSGQRHDPDPLKGLSRARLAPRLRDPRVREGVKVMNLKAVADLARDAAVLRDAGGNYRRGLEDGAGRYRGELRAWIEGRATDPRPAEFLDSFVYRADNRQVQALQRTLDRAQVPEHDRQAIWAAYERCGSDGDKQVFVENVFSAMRKGGNGDGRGSRRGSRGGMDGACGMGRDL